MIWCTYMCVKLLRHFFSSVYQEWHKHVSHLSKFCLSRKKGVLLGPGHWPVVCYVSSSSLIYIHTMHTSLRGHYVKSMGDDVEYVTGLGVHKLCAMATT